MALNLAAAAGGAAARVATDRLAGWLAGPSPSRQPLQTMGQMAQALPSNTQRVRGRGRGRRSRRGNRQGAQPRQGVNTRGGVSITIRDTELCGTVDGTFQTLSFNPGIDGTPRLKAFERMYKRYRFRYISIAYKSGSGTATPGNVWVGVLPGPVDKAVTEANIGNLKPSFFVPAWKNDSMTLGRDIDTARWMLCGDNTIDGVAFTLYVHGSAANLGVLQVSYEVEFDMPRPF